MAQSKETAKLVRHRRIRKKISGSAEKPRLTVFRSQQHIYAQLIDDAAGKTLTAASTLDKELRGQVKHGGNVDAAKKVGASIAQKALAKNIKAVVFDRGGFQYHGCVKALAEAAREHGLVF